MAAKFGTMTQSTLPAIKILNFCKSKMADGTVLKIEKSRHNGLIDRHEICHGYAF